MGGAEPKLILIHQPVPLTFQSLENLVLRQGEEPHKLSSKRFLLFTVTIKALNRKWQDLNRKLIARDDLLHSLYI